MAVPLLALVPAITDLLGGVLGTLTSDKKAQAEILMKELEHAANSQQAQAEVNKTEAASSSVFVAGWRPCIGWVCALGLFYQFVCHPFIAWYCVMKQIPVPPELSEVLWELVFGMLGMGGLRSIEKCKKKH